MDKLSDNWTTPIDLFNVLDKGGVYQGMEFEGFNFDIDVCATKENRKCTKYAIDYLNDLYGADLNEEVCPVYFKDLANNCAFMNPPYSNPKLFIEKAWEDSKHCKIVCLVKCDPSTKWWATFWDYNIEICSGCNEPTVNGKCPLDFDEESQSAPETFIYNGPKLGCEVRYFPRRIKFDPPQELKDRQEVWKVNQKWVQKCWDCPSKNDLWEMLDYVNCFKCVDKEYKELSGPTFSSALIIMDRRNV